MNNYVKETIAKFEKYRFKYGARDLFLDFVNYETAFFQIKLGNKNFEKEYMHIKNKYEEDVLNMFQECIEGLIRALDDPRDYLGEIYSHFGTQKKSLGQCFTPHKVSLAMAMLSCSKEAIENCTDKPFKVNDPCSGSGSLLLGMINTWKQQGVNYAKDTVIVAQDIDSNVAHMCYLQLSLCGAAAIVLVGNSLLLEVREQYVTLAYMLQNLISC